MSDTILAVIVAVVVISLAVLSTGVLGHAGWHKPAAIIVGVVGVILIGVQAWRGSRTQERVHEELRGIRSAADLLLKMRDEPTTPRRVVEPSTPITKRDAEIADRLGQLRHSGRKRYLEWIAGHPDAEAAAEKWRLETWGILNASYGPKIASRFNEPLTSEAVTLAVPSGTVLVLNKAIEHGYRVDRLGQIIDDIVAGKISSPR